MVPPLLIKTFRDPDSRKMTVAHQTRRSSIVQMIMRCCLGPHCDAQHRVEKTGSGRCSACRLWTKRSIVCKAIALDPNFSAAYAAAAMCFCVRKAFGWILDREKEIAEARRLARLAVQFGKDDASALCLAGHTLAFVASEIDLRSGWRRLVRRLHSSYYGVRLPAPVHHRLRLLAFPMRTRAVSCQWPDAGSPSFRRSPFARDVFFDPGRATVPRITAPLILRSAKYHGLRPCDSSISWLVRHPMQLLCTLRGRRYRRLTVG